MKLSPFFNHHARGLAVFISMCVASASASAALIGGQYGNRGIKIAGEVGEPSSQVSLQALFNMQFDPEVGMTKFSEADRFSIRETPVIFELRIAARNGTELWTGQWSLGTEFSVEGKQRILRLQDARDGTKYVFMLEPLDDRPLLRLEVIRLAITPLGPVPKPVGTYLFYRIPE